MAIPLLVALALLVTGVVVFASFPVALFEQSFLEDLVDIGCEMVLKP